MEPNQPNQSKSKKNLFWIIAGIILAVAVVITLAAWFLLGKSGGKDDSSTSTVTNTGNTVNTVDTKTGTPTSSDLKTFTGDKVKISFQYPSSWGVATETTKTGTGKLESGTEFAGLTKGSALRITFSNNSRVTIYGASSDVETDGLGGGCPIPNYFAGQKLSMPNKVYTCDTENKLPDENTTGSCSKEKVGGQDSMTILFVPATQCSAGGVQQFTYVDLPGKVVSDFSGLVLVGSIDSDYNKSIVQDANNYYNAFSQNAKESTDFWSKKYKTDAESVIAAFNSGFPKDYIAKQEKSEISALLASMKMM